MHVKFGGGKCNSVRKFSLLAMVKSRSEWESVHFDPNFAARTVITAKSCFTNYQPCHGTELSQLRKSYSNTYFFFVLF